MFQYRRGTTQYGFEWGTTPDGIILDGDGPLCLTEQDLVNLRKALRPRTAEEEQEFRARLALIKELQDPGPCDLPQCQKRGTICETCQEP